MYTTDTVVLGMSTRFSRRLANWGAAMKVLSVSQYVAKGIYTLTPPTEQIHHSSDKQHNMFTDIRVSSRTVLIKTAGLPQVRHLASQVKVQVQQLISPSQVKCKSSKLQLQVKSESRRNCCLSPAKVKLTK